MNSTEKVWICTACLARSNDRYGKDPIDQEWTKWCFISAVQRSEEDARITHDNHSEWARKNSHKKER